MTHRGKDKEDQVSNEVNIDAVERTNINFKTISTW